MKKESAEDVGATGAGWCSSPSEEDPHFSSQHQAVSSLTAFSVLFQKWQTETDWQCYLILKQWFHAFKIQSFTALWAPVDAVSAMKLNPDCKCSLCSIFSAPILMMCYIPLRARQDTLPGLGVVHGSAGSPQTSVPQEEQCLQNVGEELSSGNGQALSAGGQGQARVPLVRGHSQPRAVCSAHSGGTGKWVTLTPGSQRPSKWSLRSWAEGCQTMRWCNGQMFIINIENPGLISHVISSEVTSQAQLLHHLHSLVSFMLLLPSRSWRN